MLGFTFEAPKIDSRHVELILTCLVALEYAFQNWFYLKLGFVAFESKRDFYTEISCSTYFCKNLSKHKSLYLQLTFSHNKFYIINSLKINFLLRWTKHTSEHFILSLIIILKQKPFDSQASLHNSSFVHTALNSPTITISSSILRVYIKFKTLVIGCAQVHLILRD